MSVINDLATDQRVQKSCGVLVEQGFRVVLIGRLLKSSPAMPALPYRVHRMRLIFTSGPAFYFFFQLRLFIRLLFSRAELLYANDLDTLLPNFLISRLRNIPLIYDSHEIFCEVPELRENRLKKRIWQTLEDLIVPRLKYAITVNDSIAAYFKIRHGIVFTVVRNISNQSLAEGLTRKELGLPEDRKIILLQGAGLNMERGAEELVETMRLLPNVILLLIGGGDVWQVLKTKVRETGISNVHMIPRMPREKLMQYTMVCDLGLSIDKNTNLNYYYSLPNKLFDYIHAGLPVLVSRLPELEKIVSRYQVGEFIESHDPAEMADKIVKLLASPILQTYRKNCRQAARELNWQNEKEKLIQVISRALPRG